MSLTFIQAENNLECFEDFYRIKCDSQNIIWSGYDKAPNYENLKAWFNSQLELKTKEIWLAYIDRICVGFFYVVKENETEASGSFGVLSSYSGKGLGTKIIEKRDSIIKEKGIKYGVARVADKNIASIKCFLKLGYKKTEFFEYREIYIEAINKKVKVRYDKYVKKLF